MKDKLRDAMERYDAGHERDAEILVREYLSEDPDNPTGLHLLGGIYRRKAKWDEAIDSFDKAVRFWPPFRNAHADLNAVLAERGKLDDRFQISVITPTLGSESVARAIDSVQAQIYPNIEHLVGADGPDAERAVR